MKIGLLVAFTVMTLRTQAKAQEDPIPPGPTVTLAQAMKMANEHNLSLQVAKTDLQRAEADLKRSWSLLVPRMSGNLSLTHWDKNDSSGNNDEMRASLTAGAPLVDVQRWLGVSLAHIGKESSRLNFETVRQAKLLMVAQTYFAALAFQKLIQVHQTQLRAFDRHLQIATLRHRSGTGSRLDVLRTRTEMTQTRQDLIAARTSFNNTRDSLAVLLGMDLLPMPVQVEALSPLSTQEEELMEKALGTREDLLLSRSLVHFADKQLDSAWMGFVPTIEASWQATSQLTDPYARPAPDEKTRWSADLSLRVPLFNYARFADLDQRRAGLTKARLDLENKELHVRLEVRQALRSWKKAIKQETMAQQRSNLAKETLALAEAAYESGTGLSLDVTDARRTSRQADIDLAAKAFQAQLAQLELLRKVGQDMSAMAHPEGK
jgi:outer membrane protein TolC